MAIHYWLRYSGDNEPTAIIRVLDESDRYVAQFVNKASRWETDNRMAAQLSGIGGDVEWQEVTRETAAAFLEVSKASVADPF